MFDKNNDIPYNKDLNELNGTGMNEISRKSSGTKSVSKFYGSLIHCLFIIHYFTDDVKLNVKSFLN